MMKKLVSYGAPFVLGVFAYFLYSMLYHSEWYTKSSALTIITFLQALKIEHLISQLGFSEASLVLDVVRAIFLSLLFTALLILLTIKLKVLARNSQFITLGVLLACIIELVSPIIFLIIIKQLPLDSFHESTLTLFEQLPVTVASWYLPLLISVVLSMMVVRRKT
ncbi:hypothetical protein [Photobacterium leiognathi]|uniref:hypothetical protein n=1 Tax=Photobacterium leiognathi TaxID=553611 RepID=UPI000D16E215|nr:hypothetical protein [Photobacterium leiognathi]